MNLRELREHKLKESNRRIYNIQEMDFKKRKQLKQLICGSRKNKISNSSQTKYKKIEKNKNQKGNFFPSNVILFKGLFSFQNTNQFKKFLEILYKQVNYAVNNLQKPPIELIKLKSVKVQQTNKKILFIDLDHTLIYCGHDLQNPDVQIVHSNCIFRIKLRPHCLGFLENMSKMFDIYIFTASTLSYAKPIVQFLNQEKETIRGIFHRQQCLKTKNGFYIKDLRIIQNIQEKNIVIIDNCIHSFSFHLDNGIPVQSYMNKKNDRVLYKLQQLLTEVNNCQNICDFLQQRLKLKEIIKDPFQLFSQKLIRTLHLENQNSKNFYGF